jgi:type IV pilus assembly protein PilQ
MSALLISSPCNAKNEPKEPYRINALEWAETSDYFILAIKGGTPPTYTMYELFNPARLIIDIAEASIAPSLDMSKNLPQGPVTQIKGQVLEDKEPFIARIELFVNDESSYLVDRQDNDIIVKFAKPAVIQQSGDTADLPSIGTNDVIGEPVPPSLAEGVSETSQEASPPEEPIKTPMTLETKNATVLFDIEVEHSPNETRVFLKADGTIQNYQKSELAKDVKANRPDRMYIDVKNVKQAGPIQPIVVGTALAQIITGIRTDGFRIVFDSSLDELFDYTISEQPDGLLVTIKEPSAATSVIAGLLDSEDFTYPETAISPDSQIMTVSDENDDNNFGTQEAMLAPEDDEPTITEAKIAPPKNEIGAALAFAGYTKQRITVDFYKIDLHNVFRLFGEISNLNMVVDQAVGGSLTLALNDVPWDFALDIILNLKDLRKEERYNTIVISPKSKKFEWPERTLASVEFKEDTSINFAQQDDAGIKINQLQEIPETVVQAKNLIHQAQELEKLGNYTSALALYEEAFDKWPENTIIAKRIAALCLVHLGQNAKSVHYAKVALKADPNDYNSALQAAIGFARMEKTEQAKEYFEKSVSGPMPPSAALASYAAFSEELQQLDKALLLLKQHEDLHGDSLETMISKARIHDKQGRQDLASSEYHSILLSGYEIPADLARYIKGRASLAKE